MMRGDLLRVEEKRQVICKKGVNCYFKVGFYFLLIRYYEVGIGPTFPYANRRTLTSLCLNKNTPLNFMEYTSLIAHPSDGRLWVRPLIGCSWYEDLVYLTIRSPIRLSDRLIKGWGSSF